MIGGPREPQHHDTAGDDLPCDTLVGLRDADLGPVERRTLVLALESAQTSAEQARARAIARAIAVLPTPESSVHAGAVLERLAARRHRRTVLRQIATVGLLGAAVALAAVAWHRATPAPSAPGAVTFEAFSEIDGVQRAISHGSVLSTASPLRLSVTTATGGTLFITERFGYDTVRPVAPTSGRWEVEAGLHHVASGLLPHAAPRAIRYEAWLCPAGATRWSQSTCSRDRLLIEWRAEPRPPGRVTTD